MIRSADWQRAALDAIRTADPDGELVDTDTASSLLAGLVTCDSNHTGRVQLDPRLLVAVFGPGDPVVTALTLLVELGFIEVFGVATLTLRWSSRRKDDDGPVPMDRLAKLAERWQNRRDAA